MQTVSIKHEKPIKYGLISTRSGYDNTDAVRQIEENLKHETRPGIHPSLMKEDQQLRKHVPHQRIQIVMDSTYPSITLPQSTKNIHHAYIPFYDESTNPAFTAFAYNPNLHSNANPPIRPQNAYAGIY